MQFVGYCIVCFLIIICFVSLALCYVLIVLYFHNYSFYICFVLYILLSILCVLCFCIVLCIVSIHVHSCFFSVCVPLPPGGNPMTVNKYHTINIHTDRAVSACRPPARLL